MRFSCDSDFSPLGGAVSSNCLNHFINQLLLYLFFTQFIFNKHKCVTEQAVIQVACFFKNRHCFLSL